MELNITELEDVTYNKSQTPIINAPKTVIFPEQNPKKTKISYDDILSNMGMYVKDGKVHIYAKNEVKQNEVKQNEVKKHQNSNVKNNYIYNKYFKDDLKPEVGKRRVPKTWDEYRNMLKQDSIQRERIKKFKNTKLFLYQNTTVNTSARVTDLNKLIKFPQR